jgi:HSP20 family molecular chaperone IbpA
MNTESTCTSPSTSCAIANPAEDVRTVAPEWHSQNDNEGVTLTVALPGVPKDALELNVQGDHVTLRGQRTVPADPAVAYGLTLRLSRDLDAASAKAKLENGVLELRFSHREEAKPRQIEIAG